MSAESIGPGTVVAFHYDLYDGAAEKIESSKTGDPVHFLYGEKSVLAALQDAFRGKVAGDDFSATIPADLAYGNHYPDRIRRVPLKQLDLEGSQSGGTAGQGKSDRVQSERVRSSKGRSSKGRSASRGPVHVGQRVRVSDETGVRVATVVKAGKFNVDIDTNHPLAGRDLTFDVQVVEVRPASESERAHGHVHGPGGHARH